MFRMVILAATLVVILPVQAFCGTKCSTTRNCDVVAAPGEMCQWPVAPAHAPQIVVAPERICVTPVAPERTCTRWIKEPCSRPENRRLQSLRKNPTSVR